MEKLLVEFARRTDRERFNLRFVSLGTRGILADEIEACGWPVTALNQKDGRRIGLAFRLARLFRQWRADVVHTHNSRPLLYGAPAARLAGVRRVIHTRHGQSYGASKADRRAFRLAAKFTDRLVCVSEDSAKLSLQEGISPERVVAVWNGIDISRFQYEGPCANGPIVAVGRVSSEKSFETLIQAVALVQRGHPQVHLEIAGDGPCMPELRKLADQLGVSDRIRFLGQVRDVAAILGRASLFALPSLTEGISLTLLEAMSRGLPVVATAVGGTPEAVADGETGVLVPPRSPAELAEAILQILKAPELGRRMGLAGRRRVEAHFEVRRMVAQYEGLYLEQRVAGRNRRIEREGFPSITEETR